jgi:hypothetical protein
MSKELGKIQSIRFGMGGYEDAMVGVNFYLGGEGWGAGDFWGTWADRSEDAKWTLEDQAKIFAETTIKVRNLLKKAKVKSLDELKGIPIEAEFSQMRLVSWRILEEVL